MNKKISVVIPIYNSEKTIIRCINSVYNQTYNNIELILIDDGSTDKSGKIIDEFGKNKSNVIIKHIKNKGVSNARNQGIKLSSGYYISFIDSDDYIEKDMYKEMINCRKKDNEPDLLISYMYRKNTIKKSIITKKIDNEKFIYNALTNNDIGGFVCNKIFKTEIIKKNRILFDSNLYMCEDLDFLIRYTQYIKDIYIVKKNYYHYTTPTSSNLGFSRKRYSVVDSYNKIIEFYSKISNNTVILKTLKINLLKHNLWLWNSLLKSKKSELLSEYKYLILSDIKKYKYTCILNMRIPFKYKMLFLYLKIK